MLTWPVFDFFYQNFVRRKFIKNNKLNLEYMYVYNINLELIWYIRWMWVGRGGAFRPLGSIVSFSFRRACNFSHL